MTTTKVIDYFNGDTMSSDVWNDKYAMKNKEGVQVETSPEQMHRRMAKEFARVEAKYRDKEFLAVQTTTPIEGGNMVDFNKIMILSEFGQKLFNLRIDQTLQDIEDEIFFYFDKFSRIIPQGSIMSNLGNKYVFGSLSNCFGIQSPYDSYGGIMKTDQELVQLMKRRGGVGIVLDNLRSENSTVTNAAKSSTGVPSFAERFSNSTREVAQGGRRGALMLLLLCKHPDIFKFVTMKDDRTKVTGANVSVMFTDKFMKVIEKDGDFLCTFPVTTNTEMFSKQDIDNLEYNTLTDYTLFGIGKVSVMKIHAKELFDLVAEMAWKNAEPGVAFIDRIKDYCPDGVYELYAPTVCNPCGEQWFSADETCRLMAENYFSIVDNPFTSEAKVNIEKLYEQSYMQQRLGDDLVDLEVEYINRILDKIMDDPEPMEIKETELKLWSRIKFKAEEGRRTGGGFTGLGDMIAALGLPYDSDEALQVIEIVSKIKMEAELDATIDMAILRGTFTGWDYKKEFTGLVKDGYPIEGKNSFFQMIADDFPEQANRMASFGRRNVSWSTVAPTGTVSLMTQTTSGIEPLFKAYYIRRKKVVPGVSGVRVDFVDQSGDSWMEYAVLHPKFKEWIKTKYTEEDAKRGLEDKDFVIDAFESSPWYRSEADDIAWEKRILIQSIVQKYTSNAISSTINLPKDVEKSIVKNIYMTAWKSGLKGVTVYRDTSRTGVLVNESTKSTKKDEFGYNDAPKRPKELEADYYFGKNGHEYAIIVGKLNGKPYEVFAFANPLMQCELKGKIIKHSSGVYSFQSNSYTIEHLELSSDHKDEILLTRWVSMLLRHGSNPKYIAEQVEKSQLNVVSFPKIISRILKKYIPNEETKEKCEHCGNATMVYEEGCKKCSSCGHSKC